MRNSMFPSSYPTAYLPLCENMIDLIVYVRLNQRPRSKTRDTGILRRSIYDQP